MPKRFYWDSCVFIDRISKKPSVIAILEEITDAAARGDVVIIASTLCIAECVKIKDSKDSWTVQQKLINDFFDNPWIELVQVDSMIAERAQDIARDHGVKPPDAIHIATAIARNADVMHSYDNSKAHSPLRQDGRIGNPPLAIKIPQRFDPQLNLALTDEPAGVPSPLERPTRRLLRKKDTDGATKLPATDPSRPSKTGP